MTAIGGGRQLLGCRLGGCWTLAARAGHLASGLDDVRADGVTLFAAALGGLARGAVVGLLAAGGAGANTRLLHALLLVDGWGTNAIHYSTYVYIVKPSA